MKKRILLGLVAIQLMSCDISFSKDILAKKLNNVEKPINEYIEKIDEEYVRALSKFSDNFANVVFDDENRIFSPISMFNCFAMLYEGTTNVVKSELENTFYFSEVASLKNSIHNTIKALSFEYKKSKLDVSSSFWVDNEYSDIIFTDYLDLLANYYYAEAYAGTLESNETKKEVAKWINNKTNNMFNIKPSDLLFDEYTMLVLLNSIYLKSQWISEFEKQRNFDDDFTNIDKIKETKTFMTNTIVDNIYHGENYDIASLNLYGTVSFNMLLPHENENYLDVFKNNISNILNLNNTSHKLYEVTYKVPQFKTLSKYDLSDTMKELGLETPFTASMDYEKMIMVDHTPNGIKINAVHEAGIEINNEGIEAAAYTMIDVNDCTSIGPNDSLDPYEFNLNRPFMYALTCRGVPLFVGTYLK